MGGQTIEFTDPESLSTVMDDCWQSLERSTSAKDSGWRLPVLATNGSGELRQRILVLRKVLPAQRQFWVHTDSRSAKIAQLQQSAEVSWLFYDHGAMSQLQIKGTVKVHANDDLANDLWNSEPESSLRGYMAPMSPGTKCESPEFNLPDSVLGRIPNRSELHDARKQFAVICCHVQSIEWLLLRRDGNLRAFFEYDDSGFRADWLAP